MIPKKYLVLLSTSGLLVSLDQLTKNAVSGHLRMGESLPLVAGLLSLTHVHNKGAAFGLLATLAPEVRDPLLLALPPAVLLGILAIFYRLRPSQRLSIYALAMIVGGALGNIADRARLGFVVDFIDIHWSGGWRFPAFNLSDAAIAAGVGLLLTGILTESGRQERGGRGVSDSAPSSTSAPT